MDSSTRKLVKLILWQMALVFMLVVLLNYMGQFVGVEPFRQVLTVFLPPAIVVLFVLIATKLILSALQPAFYKALPRYVNSHHEVQYTWQFINYVVWIASFIILTFLLVGDAVSITILIAIVFLLFIFISHRALMNFAGWLYIIFQRPLRMGDLVEIGDIRGKITGITIMNTILEETGPITSNGRMTGRRVLVPNAQVLSTPVYTMGDGQNIVWDEIYVLLPATADHLLAREIISQVANSVVGPIMMKHRQDTADEQGGAGGAGMTGEAMVEGELPSFPTTTVSLEPEGVRVVLSYFCPVDEKREIRSAISENILNEFKKEAIVPVFGQAGGQAAMGAAGQFGGRPGGQVGRGGMGGMGGDGRGGTGGRGGV